jgi:hypothetical protein
MEISAAPRSVEQVEVELAAALSRELALRQHVRALERLVDFDEMLMMAAAGKVKAPAGNRFGRKPLRPATGSHEDLR